jgi:uridine kinase
MTRAALIDQIADRLAAIECPHPVRVAIDGVDGVGKTTLANDLVAPLERRGRSVIRASIDGFHNPRGVRYRQGRHSPEGYYRDSFNLGALTLLLLEPLGPRGSRRYRTAVFDYRLDAAVDGIQEEADPNAVLLFDGVFLHRPELARFWDFSLFLDADFTITVPRMAERDDTSPELDDPLNRRYVEGQRLYLRECDPKRAANVTIDCADLAHPVPTGLDGNGN